MMEDSDDCVLTDCIYLISNLDLHWNMYFLFCPVSNNMVCSVSEVVV